MQPSDSFHDTIERLRVRGSSDALAEVIGRFEGRLRAMADRTLQAAGVRARVDPEDVLQSVFHTFWKRCKSDDGRCWELDEWDDLWRLLMTFTLRRCRRHIRAHRGPTRTTEREQPLASSSSGSNELPGLDLDPHQTVAFADLMDRLLDRLSPREQLVILRLAEGYSRQEISVEQQCSYRTISRRLRHAQQVLRELEQDSSEEN